MDEVEIGYIPKGDPYPLEYSNLVGRARSWDRVQFIVRDAILAQASGWVSPEMKLKVWKSSIFDEFKWCVKWVPKEESDDHSSRSSGPGPARSPVRG